MTERGKATRARLIEATLAVVAEVGYPHASTRVIADAAGVAEGTIYRHFADKASLFFAAALASSGPVLEWVTSLPARAGQGTVAANLLDALIRLAELQDRIVPLELAISGDPELAAQRRAVLVANGGVPPGPPEAIAAYLEAEQRLGRLRADIEPMATTVIILGALFGMGVTARQAGVGVQRDHLAMLVDLFMRGMAPDG